MDPWAPINGISLERYAELSAEVEGTQDPNAQADIVGRLGVQRADWEAAKAGWTARMQDMSLMGQVATRFMPLYQTALAQKTGGAPQASFDDYVAMSGAVKMMGMDRMLQHYGLTSTQWTMIAGQWNSVIPTNPQYMQFGMLVEQEAARLRSGGAPKPVALGAPPAPAPGAPGAPAAPAPAPNPYAAAAPNPYGAQPSPYAAAPNPYGAQPNPYAQQPNPYAQQQAYYNSPQAVGAQMGSALNSFGNAMNSFFEGAVGAISVGTRVMVQWSDGRRYPATVTNSQAGQLEVGFPDGRRVWVPQAYVSMIY